MTVFNISGMIAALSVGYWCDRSEDVRKILLLVNLPQLVGQALYFAGINAEMLIVARFIAGFGLGMNSAIYSEIIRGTTREERMKVLSSAFLLRQVGIMMSPGFNIFIRRIPEFQFSLFGHLFQFNEESAPGLILFVCFFLFEIFVYFFFFNMRPLMREIYGTSQPDLASLDAKKQKFGDIDPEKKPLMDPTAKDAVNDSTGSSTDGKPRKISFVKVIYTDARPFVPEFLLNTKLLPLFLVQMICIMCQALIEAVVPPFMQEYFDLGPAEISWIFMGFGIGMLMAFISFFFVVDFYKKKQDEGYHNAPELNILLFGVLSTIIAFIGYLFVGVYVEYGNYDYFWAFIGVSGIMLVADPASVCSVTTLISLIVEEDVQEISWIFMGFGIGMLMAFISFFFVVDFYKKKQDEGYHNAPELNILLFGVLSTIIAFIGYLFVGVYVEYGNYDYFWAFIGVSGIMLVADPASVCSVTTLISLIVEEDVQGMAMGIRRCFSLIGLLIGPTLGAALIFRPWLLYGGTILVSTVGFLLLIASYNEIQETAFRHRALLSKNNKVRHKTRLSPFIQLLELVVLQWRPSDVRLVRKLSLRQLVFAIIAELEQVFATEARLRFLARLGILAGEPRVRIRNLIVAMIPLVQLH
ncbi:unnamed protein product, partial [Notodromas monacha]